MAKSMLRKRIRYVLAVFWVAAFAWMFGNMQARGVPDSELDSDARVRVEETTTQIVFTPIVDTTGVGLVFYPGAIVDPIAYVPFARDIAGAGFKVVIRELPFRQAPLKSQQLRLFEETESLIREDTTRRWVVGGHSRGGALAARFAFGHEAMLAGLLLVGTSHPRKDDLSGIKIAVMKIYGSNDGLASPEEVDAYRHLLPPSTRMVRIEGGNHAHFAWYGRQFGDHSASIPRSEQHAQTVRAALEFLKALRPTVFRDTTQTVR